ncbi:MAG: 1-deoxy-D-xylulose-5-phosphate reductoisomerase [Actinobacteria bacterium]|uniref:1-deoxy-D-xylulose-5-phosphate reductoisomerase n=1 Tax=freshwater metagenome TaxID=449393 RepID=A0A6J6MN00_9ZZZZ|nr:1-deoxy-D-xylulose-5-phosphate reductoisomerase [Actinomycetota bacterium]
MVVTRVAIAGSSGSIGTQTIDVVLSEPDKYRVTALAVGSSADTVIAQAKQLRPDVVVVTDEKQRAIVAAALPGIAVTSSLTDVVDVADVVINGVVGFAGLSVTLETLRAGKTLGLANKESLIAAGPLVQPLRRTPGAQLVPVDSEHCAIHQCLRSSSRPESEVARIVLTASGGPFRGRSASSLAGVTVNEALAHPTWKMGPKITIDSSTLMNKGLEVIEAHELFGTSFDNIDVVVHPQSVVHSMVEFTDGSTIAQLSMPDMRLPIGYALGYPHRIATPFGRIDWSTLSRLDFEPPDRQTFMCLDLAYAAGKAGGTAPAALSAANEIVVEAFLAGKITWAQIGIFVSQVMEKFTVSVPTSVDDVLNADAEGRRLAREELAR